MRAPLAAVCVYAGSNPGLDPAYADAARDVGAVLAARGTVTGVIPQDLVDKEVAHPGLSELVVVESMHERKLAMADRSQAFVALPGGVGTLEELFEVLTWTQLGIH